MTELDQNDLLAAKQRFIEYRKTNDVSVLFDDSVVKIWNVRAINAVSDNLVPKPSKEFFQHMHSKDFEDQFKLVANYLASSPLANDGLLLVAFAVSGNLQCFERIKDRTFISQWLLLQNKAYIANAFIRRCHLLPKDRLIEIINSIGIPYALDIGLSFNADALKKISDIIIRFNATTVVLSETERIEYSDWYGGHFVNYEGSRDQKQDEYYYRVIDFNYCLFVESSRFSDMTTCNNLLQDEFQKQIALCLINKTKRAFIAGTVQGKQYLLQIDVNSESLGDPGDFTPLLCVEKAHEEILINTKTYQE